MSDFVSKYTRMVRRINDDNKETVRKQLIMTALNKSDLELKAVMHDTTIGLQQLLALQVDDVIPLFKNVNSGVTIKVDEVPWFNGQLGSVKNKKAVQLSGVVEK